MRALPFQSVRHFVKSNWINRKLTADLVHRDFKIRYLGSLLGSYWNFVHPIAMISVYTIVFSQVMQAKIGTNQSPFAFTLYLCAGLLPWTAFSEMVMRGTVAFQDNANFIKKISFPKEILQTVISFSSLITLLISFGIYSLLLLILGHGVSHHFFLVPLILLIQITFATGLGMTLSVLNVFYRDVQQFINIVFQVWFWLTPIVYIETLIPQHFRFFLSLNPMYYIIKLYQDIFYRQIYPSIEIWIYAMSFSLLTFLFGCYTVSHFKDEVVDEL